MLVGGYGGGSGDTGGGASGGVDVSVGGGNDCGGGGCCGGGGGGVSGSFDQSICSKPKIFNMVIVLYSVYIGTFDP